VPGCLYLQYSRSCRSDKTVSELRPPTGPLLIPRRYMSMESHGGTILTGGNRRTRRETCPSVSLFTTNATWTDTGANSDLRGERPATDRLNGTTTYILQVSKAELSFNEILISVCLWEKEGRKHTVALRLLLLDAGGYDVPRRSDGPGADRQLGPH
jgi:hypothetical protein